MEIKKAVETVKTRIQCNDELRGECKCADCKKCRCYVTDEAMSEALRTLVDFAEAKTVQAEFSAAGIAEMRVRNTILRNALANNVPVFYVSELLGEDLTVKG